MVLVKIIKVSILGITIDKYTTDLFITVTLYPFELKLRIIEIKN